MRSVEFLLFWGGHRSYRYHAFQDKSIFFFFEDLFIIVRIVYFPLFCQGHKICEVFKTCNPPKEWNIHIAHDLESSLYGHC